MIYLQKKNNKMENNNQNQINIELPKIIGRRIHKLSHYHTPNPRVCGRFCKISYAGNKAKVKSRIILTPQHAKRPNCRISRKCKKFEQMHGEIKDFDQVSLPLNFGTPTTQA